MSVHDPTPLESYINELTSWSKGAVIPILVVGTCDLLTLAWRGASSTSSNCSSIAAQVGLEGAGKTSYLSKLMGRQVTKTALAGCPGESVTYVQGALAGVCRACVTLMIGGRCVCIHCMVH
jgi:hypothetical protein